VDFRGFFQDSANKTLLDIPTKSYPHPRSYSHYSFAPPKHGFKQYSNSVDEEITDSDLPFVRVSSKMADTTNSGLIYSLCRKDHGREPEGHVSCGIKTVSSWSQRDLGNLWRDQWVVQAPVFGKATDAIPHLDMPREVVKRKVVDKSQ
jgi:hypothetical protein